MIFKFKLIIKLLLFILASNSILMLIIINTVIANTENKNGEVEVRIINDMKNFQTYIEDLQKQNPECVKNKTLVIFDIDETLLTREFAEYCQQFYKEHFESVYFCSSEKFGQIQEIKTMNDELLSFVLKLNKKSWDSGSLFQLLCPTQKNISKVVGDIQKLEGVDVVALTSRPASFENYINTRMELEKIAIDFKTKKPILKSSFENSFSEPIWAFDQSTIEKMDDLPQIVKGELIDRMNHSSKKYQKYVQYNLPADIRKVFYKDGIFMTSFFHKGYFLRSLYSNSESKYACIVAVDDSPKRINQLKLSFEGLPQNIKPSIFTLFKYTKVVQGDY
ncbi:MAG: DUF2608 domain-containing protein [Oligoflexia bacterium]|nr:DUF2608 domain-containing protein [Oligoflexia bacterium]